MSTHKYRFNRIFESFLYWIGFILGKILSKEKVFYITTGINKAQGANTANAERK